MACGYQAFFIQVTPSCSVLPMGAAAVCVSLFLLGGTLRRRIGGALAALTLMAAGNLPRLVAVIRVGGAAGVPTMVAFHDWVGTVFSYVLLFTTVVFLIATRLPGRKARR
ncbi:exosortase/archaeosortase family protein [Actinocorallia herbida]|uniref:Exosortase/archaeosortase family protein n=1 Tax=Actinocorallia herbida TaxID=58109 RepID=A0A3N1CWN6_9ACTN|nr:hypothetical protein [Actinocorallia herbida]ROO85701.1 exosortase/archaeosortase family protein [Actinocorallia herbida]